jgi:hypothetical protein
LTSSNKEIKTASRNKIKASVTVACKYQRLIAMRKNSTKIAFSPPALKPLRKAKLSAQMVDNLIFIIQPSRPTIKGDFIYLFALCTRLRE